MKLIREKDLEKYKEIVDEKLEKIEDIKLNKFIPTKKTQMEINKIVLEFIKKKKRKIYGGYAQNKLVELKNKDDVFYKKDKIPDIDIYSPEPIKDIIELSNILYDKGYKNVKSSEALHKETYSLFVEFENMCDISYVPTMIYNRIPFVEDNGIRYVGKKNVMIDFMKMITDPYFSSFRWEKIMPRIMLLEKYYPEKNMKFELKYKKPSKNISDLLDSIEDYVQKNKNTMTMIGDYAYNYYVKKEDQINTNVYQIVTINYNEDTIGLIKKLKEKYKNINIIENYPFWSLNDYSCDILYGDKIVCRIFNYFKRCVLTQSVKMKNNKKKYINIGNFDYTLLHIMIDSFRCRVNKESCEKDNIKKKINMIKARNDFLDKNKKTIFDNTLYESFMIECKGEQFSPFRQERLETDRKFKEGKRGNELKFRYSPESEYKKPESNYKFPNSSGNVIRNEKNYRIINIL